MALPVDAPNASRRPTRTTSRWVSGRRSNEVRLHHRARTWASVEAIVDQFVADVNTEVNGNAPGPDICASKKIAEAGKKFGQVAKCYATSAKKGTAPADACVQKAADRVRARAQEVLDGRAEHAARDDRRQRRALRSPVQSPVPSTTTTSTTTTSTTSTTASAPALGPALHVHQRPGHGELRDRPDE